LPANKTEYNFRGLFSYDTLQKARKGINFWQEIYCIREHNGEMRAVVNLLCQCSNISERDCWTDPSFYDSQFLSSKH